MKPARLSWMTVFMCTALMLRSAASGHDSTTARILIINSPENPVVSVNGKEYPHDVGGWYEVPAGELLVEIICAGKQVYSSQTTVQAGQEKGIMLGCRINCASLKVVSNPPGADVSIDGEQCGRTPYLNCFVQPGNHELLLMEHNYAPQSASIALKPDSLELFSYKLGRSKEYKDSVAFAAKKKREARQRIQKIFFASIAGMFAITGAGFDYQAYSENTRADHEAGDYLAARSGFAPLKATYYRDRNKAQKALGYRNIMYGAAGACVAAFGISFVF